jgi:beta-xylosidase
MKIKTLDQTDRGTNILPDATWGEGNKIFKKDGYYYLYHNECFGKDYDRQAVMIRSKNLYGTKPDGTPGKPGDPGLYDISPQGKQSYLMVHPDSTGGRLDQGALLDTPDGKKWYFLTHQGGGYENGRPTALLPVTWVDGWPMAGKDHDNDKIGEPVWEAEKPVQGQKKRFLRGAMNSASKRCIRSGCGITSPGQTNGHSPNDVAICAYMPLNLWLTAPFSRPEIPFASAM